MASVVIDVVEDIRVDPRLHLVSLKVKMENDY